MSRQPVTVLLTATIAPEGGITNRVADSAVRTRQYLDALSFYISQLGGGIDRIVLIDNSPSDMSDFEALASGKPVRIVQYRPPAYPPEWGYALREMAMVEHAMDMVPELAEGIVIKVTGRYRVANICQIARSVQGADIAVDIWNRKRPWADMRVMAWTARGFNQVLRGTYERLRDDVNRLPAEMILSGIILQSHDVAVVTYLPIGAQVEGVRGFDGKDWGKGRLALKRVLRDLTRPLYRRFGLHAGAAREARNP